jgi:hypothetical protein
MTRKYKLAPAFDDYTVEAATAKVLMRGGFRRGAEIIREIYGDPELSAAERRGKAVYAALKSLRFQKLAVQTGEHWSWL